MGENLCFAKYFLGIYIGILFMDGPLDLMYRKRELALPTIAELCVPPLSGMSMSTNSDFFSFCCVHYVTYVDCLCYQVSTTININFWFEISVTTGMANLFPFMSKCFQKNLRTTKKFTRKRMMHQNYLKLSFMDEKNCVTYCDIF